jgi:PAS domain S-box-containing protein
MMHTSKDISNDRKAGKRDMVIAAPDTRGERDPDFADLFENATVGLQWAGADGVILRANPAMLTMLGYTEDQYIGRHVSETHADPGVASDILARLMRGESIRDCRAQLRASDGSLRDVLISSSARTENGQFVSTRCFIVDVSETVRAERRVQARDMVTRALAESRTLEEASPLILAAVCRQLDWQVGGLWLVDERENVLRYVHMCGFPRAPQFEVVSREHVFAPGIGLPGRVWAEGKPAWIADVTADPNFPRTRAAAAEDLHGAFGFPITFNQKVLGVMEFFSAETRPPDADLLEMMETIGSQVGQFIERWRAEEVLYRTQDRLRAELSDAKLLHEISSTMIHEHNVEALYNSIVDAAVTIMNSQYSSLQMYYPEDSPAHGGELRLLAYRGFSDHAATFWEWVKPSQGCTCGIALRTGRRVISPDVEKDPDIAGTEDLAAYLETGIHAVQTTPLLSRDGSIVGMISTHWSEPHAPSKRDLRMFDILARQAADLIERKHAEDALRESDRRKDEFLAILSHELRNPLAPIGYAAEIMKRSERVTPEMQWVREVLDRQVHQMGRLLDDLLDISRITRGTIELRRRPVELRTVVNEAIEAVRPLIEQNQHELLLDIPEEPVFLDADATRLGQMLLNLINNAAKYTDRGGKIWVSASVEDGTVTMRVKDDGIGIPAEMLTRIFDMFTQVDRTKEHMEGGLGIGLTLAQRLVMLHGGEIKAISQGDGCGSEFVVRLPRLEVDASVAPELVKSNGHGIAPLRILVVDDNVDAADSMSMFLEYAGHEVRTANDGLSAVAAAHEFRPYVILLDIGLPKMHGHDVAQTIRKDRGNDVIVIALTGWGQEEDRRRSREAGFDYHLTKPVDFDELNRLLGAVNVREGNDSASILPH